MDYLPLNNKFISSTFEGKQLKEKFTYSHMEYFDITEFFTHQHIISSLSTTFEEIIGNMFS